MEYRRAAEWIRRKNHEHQALSASTLSYPVGIFSGRRRSEASIAARLETTQVPEVPALLLGQAGQGEENVSIHAANVNTSTRLQSQDPFLAEWEDHRQAINAYEEARKSAMDRWEE